MPSKVQQQPSRESSGDSAAAAAEDSAKDVAHQAEGVYANPRMTRGLSAIIGCTINLKTGEGYEYEGICEAISPKMEVIMRLAHSLEHGNPEGVFGEKEVCVKRDMVYDQIMFSLQDITEIALIAECDLGDQTKGFLDSEISGNGRSAGEMRQLEMWVSEDDDDHEYHPPVDHRRSTSQSHSQGWEPDEMFRRNEELTGNSTTYNEEMSQYSNVPVPDADAAARARAEALAREIESNPASQRHAELENEDEEVDLDGSNRRPPMRSAGPSDSANWRTSAPGPQGVGRDYGMRGGRGSSRGIGRGGRGGAPNRGGYATGPPPGIHANSQASYGSRVIHNRNQPPAAAQTGSGPGNHPQQGPQQPDSNVAGPGYTGTRTMQSSGGGRYQGETSPPSKDDGGGWETAPSRHRGNRRDGGIQRGGRGGGPAPMHQRSEETARLRRWQQDFELGDASSGGNGHNNRPSQAYEERKTPPPRNAQPRPPPGPQQPPPSGHSQRYAHVVAQPPMQQQPPPQQQLPPPHPPPHPSQHQPPLPHPGHHQPHQPPPHMQQPMQQQRHPPNQPLPTQDSRLQGQPSEGSGHSQFQGQTGGTEVGVAQSQESVDSSPGITAKMQVDQRKKTPDQPSRKNSDAGSVSSAKSGVKSGSKLNPDAPVFTPRAPATLTSPTATVPMQQHMGTPLGPTMNQMGSQQLMHQQQQAALVGGASPHPQLQAALPPPSVAAAPQMSYPPPTPSPAQQQQQHIHQQYHQQPPSSLMASSQGPTSVPFTTTYPPPSGQGGQIMMQYPPQMPQPPPQPPTPQQQQQPQMVPNNRGGVPSGGQRKGPGIPQGNVGGGQTSLVGQPLVAGSIQSGAGGQYPLGYVIPGPVPSAAQHGFTPQPVIYLPPQHRGSNAALPNASYMIMAQSSGGENSYPTVVSSSHVQMPLQQPPPSSVPSSTGSQPPTPGPPNPSPHGLNQPPPGGPVAYTHAFPPPQPIHSPFNPAGPTPQQVLTSAGIYYLPYGAAAYGSFPQQMALDPNQQQAHIANAFAQQAQQHQQLQQPHPNHPMVSMMGGTHLVVGSTMAAGQVVPQLVGHHAASPAPNGRRPPTPLAHPPPLLRPQPPVLIPAHIASRPLNIST